jgi:hypothetical protein
VGITEVVATPYRPGVGGPGEPGGYVVRIAPVSLPASAKIRLTRLAPKALLKEPAHELIVPIGGNRAVVDELHSLIAQLYPEDD